MLKYEVRKMREGRKKQEKKEGSEHWKNGMNYEAREQSSCRSVQPRRIIAKKLTGLTDEEEVSGASR